MAMLVITRWYPYCRIWDLRLGAGKRAMPCDRSNDQVLLNISFYDLDLDEAHIKKVAISDDIVIYTHI